MARDRRRRATPAPTAGAAGIHQGSSWSWWDGGVSDAPDALPEPFDCPRCGSSVVDRFWGPCEHCRTELRTQGGPGREVEAEAYVPKVNVTPNAVALKDD